MLIHKNYIDIYLKGKQKVIKNINKNCIIVKNVHTDIHFFSISLN